MVGEGPPSMSLPRPILEDVDGSPSAVAGSNPRPTMLWVAGYSLCIVVYP